MSKILYQSIGTSLEKKCYILMECECVLVYLELSRGAPCGDIYCLIPLQKYMFIVIYLIILTYNHFLNVV